MRRFNRYTVLSVAAMLVMLLGAMLAEAHMGSGRDGGFMMKRLLKGLDLSSRQEQQIKAIVQDHKSELRADMTAVLQARRNLLAVSTAAPFDENAVQTAQGMLSEAQGHLTVLRAEMFSQVMAVLTPEQQATVKDKLARLSQRMQHGIERLQAKESPTTP